MLELSEVLSRIGVKELTEMLGEDASSLLEKLDVRNITSTRLAKLILKEMDASSLLLETKRRHIFFDALKKSDAEKLCQKLQITIKDDAWSTLKKKPFSKGTNVTKLLFEFFNCELPDEENEIINLPVDTIDSSYPLFQHQRVAVKEVHSFLANDPRRVLLHMPTGSGKTRTAMNVIAEFLRGAEVPRNLTVWLAHSEELCDQAVEEFQKAWHLLGDRDVNIYRYYSKYDFDLSKASNGIVVAGLGKLYKRSLSQMASFLTMSHKVNLVVMDEAHQATAPTYQHLLDLLAPTNNIPILGLSATPGRSFLNPGEDIKLAQYFCNNKVTLNVDGFVSPIDYLQKEGYLSVPEFIKLPYNPSFQLSSEETRKLSEDLEIPFEIIAKLARDERRNLSILRRVIQEAEEGNKIIIFACSVDHAKLLSNLLNVKGLKCAAITSSTPSHLRSNLIKQFKETSQLNILTNYGVLTTGFDAPKTNVAFIVRPTKSVVLYSQMIGRVIRGPKVGGNKTCKIITLNDQLANIKTIADGFGFWEDVW